MTPHVYNASNNDIFAIHRQWPYNYFNPLASHIQYYSMTFGHKKGSCQAFLLNDFHLAELSNFQILVISGIKHCILALMIFGIKSSIPRLSRFSTYQIALWFSIFHIPNSILILATSGINTGILQCDQIPSLICSDYSSCYAHRKLVKTKRISTQQSIAFLILQEWCVIGANFTS